MKNINVHITNNCNFDCEVCFENTDRTNPKYIDKTKLLKFIDDYKPKHVGFVGGEPLLHPDLPVILEELRAKGIHTCVVTNGEMLNTGAWAPDKWSIGIDNDDQIEVDKWLEANKAKIESFELPIEITITPTDITKIDALIKKYKALKCGINISLLAFWNKNTSVSKDITDEYVQKMIELKGSVVMWGDENIQDFYDGVVDKDYYCCAPLNIYSDGHMEWCDLEYFPIADTLDSYDVSKIIKPGFVMRDQCKACNLRRTLRT